LPAARRDAGIEVSALLATRSEESGEAHGEHHHDRRGQQ
jgi:hypothetical protein